jgi:RES domain-containing protein
VIEAWRIAKRRYADTAFDGEGARLHGGRWNSPGRPVVYVSESRALATLEILAGLGSTAVLPAWVLIGVRFPESIVTDVGSFLASLGREGLPAGWNAAPPTPASQQIGDLWLERGESAVLRVPSVIVPAEHNYLLNPRQSDFGRVEIRVPEEMRLDPRLVFTRDTD